MCTFYFADNMFDKDSLACVDVFFPSTVLVHALFSMGARSHLVRILFHLLL
ncbi:unnamed protein product [Penicillium roqueforti FM164]|uniref:Genomic scaffold, ProqFM164S01 n=1 Tax=Penicillium roqueforti (strain FM164) TaxID=1365484 RepID=W6Q1J7_PENRF|nr:unnamed protein product [Penicillium roqueforti FM164]